MEKSKEWFKYWFNTPYYHLLYNHRNQDEANFFLNKLLDHLPIKENSKILDAACGKGRHSIYLNSKGFDVTGVDLSSESIMEAKKSENDTLSFFEHDIRSPFRVNYFDAVFNLFTSFGYFETTNENLLALKSFYNSLKSGGYLVLDFFNSIEVSKNLNSIKEHTIIKNKVEFKITKEIQEKFIVKKIQVIDGTKVSNFEEKVQLLKKEELEKWLIKTGFKIVSIKGDYSLNEFNSNSERLIIIAQKS